MTTCSSAATNTTATARSQGAMLIGRSVGTRTMTASSAPKSTYGSTCTCWKRSVSVWPTLVTLPIGIPFGKSELSAPARHPAVTISCPTRTTSCLRTRSSTSVSRVPRAWRTIPVAPVRRSMADAAASSSVRSWTRAVPGRDLRDDADEAVGGDDRIVEADAVVGARGDDDRLRERDARATDDLGHVGLKSAGKRGPSM